MFLLDTNVVSEMRRDHPHGGVAAWVSSIAEADLAISSVTLGEIQAGIEITRLQDIEKATELERWADLLTNAYNVLPMDAQCFRLWAKLMHGQSDTLYEDAMIAATALVHGLAVATRNTRDFQMFDVSLFNPFEFGR